jgi:hypothetical protein
MLHLPAPHQCPACRGEHVARGVERSAASLRPYFGTYTPSKFPLGSGATPVVATANMSATTPGAGSLWQFSGGAANGLGTWNAGDFTVSKAGYYAISFRHLPISTNTGTLSVTLRRATSPIVSQFVFACTNGTQTTYAGGGDVFCNNGDVIDIQGNASSGSNGAAATGTIRLVFVPTPNNPQ